MIQRVQTIYFLIALILYVFVATGSPIVRFHVEGTEFPEHINVNLSSFGIDADAQLNLSEEELTEFKEHLAKEGAEINAEANVLSWKKSIPVFVTFSLIGVFLILAIGLFKKQKKQLKLGRIAFLISILSTIGLFVIIMFIPSKLKETAETVMLSEEVSIQRSLGLNFYLLCASVPFIFLGNLGVRRDLNLLKSLDRLR
jgi:cytochrome bd-type quinol oxidase subunit 2